MQTMQQKGRAGSNLRNGGGAKMATDGMKLTTDVMKMGADGIYVK